jgi:hypothetical protein
MELVIRSKDDYPIHIDTEYVHINSISERYGWYISIFSDILYLHKDGFIRNGITDVNLDLGYWTSKEDAENFYSEWKDGNLKIEILL